MINVQCSMIEPTIIGIGHWTWTLIIGFSPAGRVTPCQPLRVLRILGRETETLQRSARCSCRSAGRSNRLRRDRRISSAKIVCHHVGRDEVSARQLRIRLLGGFIRGLECRQDVPELRGDPLKESLSFRRGGRRSVGFFAEFVACDMGCVRVMGAGVWPGRGQPQGVAPRVRPDDESPKSASYSPPMRFSRVRIAVVGTPESQKVTFCVDGGLQDMRLSACWPLLAIILSAASLAGANVGCHWCDGRVRKLNRSAV